MRGAFPSITRTTYRPDIDGLRAIAVLAVIAFHAGWIGGGFVGVDVFFVISGYLISGIVFRGAGERGFVASFYAGRVRRIFPALIVVLAACLAGGWFLLLPDELQSLGKHVFSGAAFVSNFALSRGAGYFDTEADLKPLLHLWSLGIEEQFYLVWPALIIAAVRLKWNVPLIILALLAGSLALDLIFIGSRPITVFYWPATRLWELLAGAALARLELGNLSLGIASQSAASLAGIALIAIGVLDFDRTMRYPGWLAILPVFGSVLFIAAGPDAPVNRYLLSLKPLIGIGLISYPLYLWHWPLLSFVRIIESGDPDPRFIFVAVALSFPLAWLTYRLVERPIRFGSSDAVGLKVISLSAGLGTVAALALALYLSDGLPSRIPYYSVTSPNGSARWTDVTSCKNDFPALADSYFCMASLVQEPGAGVDLIIGDSHAESFARGLSLSPGSLGHKNLYNISYPGCPPFLAIDRYEAGKRRESCRFREAIEQISQHRGINNLVLVGRFAMYATADGFGVDGDIRPGVIRIERSDGLAAKDNASILAYGLEETLKAYLPAAHRITLVLQAPELGFDPKSCIDARPLRLSRHIRTPCAVSRRDVENRRNSYIRSFDAVLRKFPDVRVVDPVRFLCDLDLCYAIEAGDLLYEDNNHLSVFGSAKILADLTTLRASQ